MNVSRETKDRLKSYESQLLKWNSSINLVSKHQLQDIWHRHILDSIQVYDRVAAEVNRGDWVDVGSGGGLPAIVCAILDSDHPSYHITMVESDSRKCAFLRHCRREFELNASVLNQRIETLCDQVQAYDVVTARALADLGALLGYSKPILRQGGVMVFPKGRLWKAEIEEAKKEWSFDYESVQSSTDPEAAIIVIKGDSCERK